MNEMFNALKGFHYLLRLISSASFSHGSGLSSGTHIVTRAERGESGL